jgi:hypothetical protein
MQLTLTKPQSWELGSSLTAHLDRLEVKDSFLYQLFSL